MFQPENILLDDNMNVKLSDFGFATIIQHDKQMSGQCHNVPLTVENHNVPVIIEDYNVPLTVEDRNVPLIVED